MNTTQQIIDRNHRISRHLDGLHTMWKEGKISHEDAKRVYKVLVANIILWGHYDIFADEFPPTVEEPAAPPVVRRRFTEEDIETLKRLYARGRTAREIGASINRTTYTVQQVIARLQTQKVLPKRYNRKASASNINNNNEGK